MKCDICGIENEKVIAGRWIFYCPKHKKNDLEMTKENELSSNGVFFGDESDINYALSDGELCEMLLESF